MEVTEGELIDAFFDDARRPAADQERRWAWHHVRDVIRADPEESWRLILRLLSAATDRRTLGSVVAGPLEEWIDKYAETKIGRVLAEASSNRRLQWALHGVWEDEEELPAAIREQLESARLRWPKPPENELFSGR